MRKPDRFTTHFAHSRFRPGGEIGLWPHQRHNSSRKHLGFGFEAEPDFVSFVLCGKSAVDDDAAAGDESGLGADQKCC